MVETRSISAGVPPRGSLATTPRSNGSAKSTNGSVHKLSGAVFTHTPTALTLIWLAVSLPLVAWDTGYVLLRPYSMPGGSLHWPLWVPYELYGRVDHVYGWPAWNSRSGFTGAQSIMNVVETVLYVVYLGLYFAQGQGQTIKTVKGRVAAVATLVLFSSSVMTLSKTVLYGELFFCFVVCSRCFRSVGWLASSRNAQQLCRLVSLLTDRHKQG